MSSINLVPATIVFAFSLLGCAKPVVEISNTEPDAAIVEVRSMTCNPVRYPGPRSELLYNVPPFEMTPADAEEEEYNDVTRDLRRNTPPSGFFCTIKNPTPIYGDEVARISIDAEMAVRDYIKEHKIPGQDELGNEIWRDMPDFIVKAGKQMGCLEPSDRTLLIPLTSSVLYSPAFIRMLQEKVVQKHPSWRMIVHLDACGYEYKNLIPLAIYPDAVTTDTEQWDMTQLDDKLRMWQEQTRRVFDHTRGAHGRQLRCVVQRIPALLQRLKSEPIVFVLASDNYEGEDDSHVIWVLQSVSERVLTPVLPEGFMAGASFYFSNGHLSNIYRKEQSYICSYTLPPNAKHHLTFRYMKKEAQEWEILPGVVDKAEFEIQVKPNEMLTDGQLKADPRLQAPLEIEFIP